MSKTSGQWEQPLIAKRLATSACRAMAERSRRRCSTGSAPQPHAAGRATGVCRARDAAADRAGRAAQRRHRLHEPDARRRDPQLQRSNVEVLQEQLRQTRDRFTAGEVTRTDVAQAESRLRRGRAYDADGGIQLTSPRRSTYRQVIGAEPGTLAPAARRSFSPRTLGRGWSARGRHPAVTTAMFNVDAAVFQVKVAESSLFRPQPGRQRPADLRLDDRR